MLEVVNLIKTYKTKKADTVYALNGVSIQFPETGLVFLLGKSGSGKSTLLNAIGGLDQFDSGEIIIKGKSSKDFTQSDFDSYRNTFIGFIFQEYNILENFTVAKNLSLALELQGKKADKEEVDKLLSQVDMLAYANRKPNQLSGGQKQRVAIARALIKNPEIIMADEPTGALDSNTGKQVMDTLKELSKSKLVIIVSHDRDFAEQYGDRIIELKDGKIIRDVTKKAIESSTSPTGISVIDDNLIYIKQGGNITDSEVSKLAQIIKIKSQNQDVFLSFDEKANAKLKEGASINDNGNKEAFLETKPEDIHANTYNGKDLKLIKSHLKFSDSFKMGASSLKTKVGKLIFTIILAFFAFTVFGVVDTFSTWNRATSVYQGIVMDNQKVIVAMKEVKKDNYNQSRETTIVDLENLKTKFPSYTFIPVYANNNYLSSSHNIYIEGVSLKNTNNPAWAFTHSGIISLTQDKLNEFNLTLLEGKMPSSHGEIAITKHLWNCAKHNDEDGKLSTWTDLKIRVNNVAYTIVGIIDTHTDLSKYQNLSDGQLATNYNIGYELGSSISNFLFVHESDETQVEKSLNGSATLSWTLNDESVSTRSIYADFTTLNEYYNNFRETYHYQDYEYKEKFLNQMIDYYKGGKDKLFNEETPITLGQGEIFITPDIANEVTDYKSVIDSGNFNIKVYMDYEHTEFVTELKVVGTTSGYNYSSIASNDVVEFMNRNVTGYHSFVTALNGTNDETLVSYLETYNNKVKYPIQNSTTQIFDNFESIIDIASTIFIYIAIAFAIFASLLLMNFISTSISNKKREIGVLRALGARGTDIFGIFLNESTIISLINFAVSAIATFIVCKVINAIIIKKIGASIVLLNFGLRQILLILAISWITAFLASLIPSIKISKKRPIDAINNR